eukprot:5864088-Pyramimonas_sp.AAC.1
MLLRSVPPLPRLAPSAILSADVSGVAAQPPKLRVLGGCRLVVMTLQILMTRARETLNQEAGT